MSFVSTGNKSGNGDGSVITTPPIAGAAESLFGDLPEPSGLVKAARVVDQQGWSVTYELRIEPWVKLLTHTSDYKAFQNKTVVGILDEVLAEYPYLVEKRLVENYPTRTRQVQYGETDFDFIQRLMQEWGIYWWFEHSENSHTLVLADAISAHKACPDSHWRIRSKGRAGSGCRTAKGDMWMAVPG